MELTISYPHLLLADTGLSLRHGESVCAPTM